MTTSEILAVCAISLLAISALMAFGSFFNVNVFSSAPDWAYSAGLASSALSKKDQNIYWISIPVMIFIAIVLLAVSQLLAPENYRAARGLGSSPDYCAVDVNTTGVAGNSCVCADYQRCGGKEWPTCAQPPECKNECRPAQDEDCPKVNGKHLQCNISEGPGPDGYPITWTGCEDN